MTDYTPATTYEFDDLGVTGRLDATGIAGKPSATVSIDGRDLSRVKIRKQDTRHTVEGVLAESADGDRVSVTLIVPVVQLSKRAVPASALVVLSSAHTSIGGPQLVKGALETLTTREISGRAKILQS